MYFDHAAQREASICSPLSVSFAIFKPTCGLFGERATLIAPGVADC